MIRSTLANVVRSLLTGVSRRVSGDGLFEQPGERARTPPLQRAAGTSGPAPSAPPVRAAAPKSAARRPAEGCVPVDLAGLMAAITPAGRALVVNHWAAWCDPCVDELPRLVRSAAGLADEAEFIGVSWDLFDHPGDPVRVARKVGAFAASSGVGYPSVLFTGAPAELFAACGLDVELIPQTLVLTPDGAVAWHKKGVLTDDDVFPLIAAVRAANRPQ